MKRKLTPKQRKFANEYIKSGNAADAARKAGYSKQTARTVGQQNLTKLDIKEYIDEQMAEIESSKIADAKEVMEFYTRVLRGEELETVVVGTADGAESIERPPTTKDKTAVAKEILKRYPGNDKLVEQQIRKLKADADIAEAKAKRSSKDNQQVVINFTDDLPDDGQQNT
ncbi:terminase small subunit [Lactiplantibacillus plantarum]|uniref:terminase small subunit n=1 Tax=Lactiplantibacillus plantarum TaxID=1590 RepID=UPI0003AABF77|nr:terminase small subunit [Lactiplantibacillus plantarum]AGL64742.2 Prophage Lp2 protein 34 [Lactiplantibacillus plantarum subsp. plantarum P-8]MBR7567649.1 terminase small subunit [Lactiplantibacillus plantarum]MBR7624269.1 terminase small subunit [Lactiplantibacillus plantarum]MBR7625960.1 terminase small subunit [Lactiplantibacillus plantarum]MBR7645148.1 terminase small subunit [Lactiplantibacillus plantarum]